MPRVNLGKKQPPPIDWLWAATLERRAALGVTIKDMAKMCHVSYATMRNYAARSPWEWTRGMRDAVCRELGIIVNTTPNGNELGVSIG